MVLVDGTLGFRLMWVLIGRFSFGFSGWDTPLPVDVDAHWTLFCWFWWMGHSVAGRCVTFLLVLVEDTLAMCLVVFLVWAFESLSCIFGLRFAIRIAVGF